MSAEKTTEAMAPSIEQEDFGATNDGTKVGRYLLRNVDIEVAVITWGAVVQSVRVPDRRGRVADVVLGYDGLDGYLDDSAYLGAVVGRYANRIAHGRFALGGVDYQVPCNDRGNALHGGPEGFNRQVWSASTTRAPDKVAVELTHLSPGGTMGFPGNLTVAVTYSLERSCLRIEYAASSDKPTVLNLTQHTYFNLHGQGTGTIESHVLSVPASRYLPVDAEGIPLGPAASIHGTPLDFRRAKAVGRDLRAGSAQLAATRGFDHSLLLDGWRQGHVIPAARMEEPETGRFLELLTDQPAVALLGQHAGRVSGRQRTANLPSERRSVPRDTALPGFTEQELLPQCRPQTGRAVEVDDDVEVRIVRRSCGATGQGLAIHTNVEVTT